MIKQIKSFFNKLRNRRKMNGYIKELEKGRAEHLYNFTIEDAIAEKIEIERTFNTFVLPDQEVPESTYDPKASFVTYNGIPYNKQTK